MEPSDYMEQGGFYKLYNYAKRNLCFVSQVWMLTRVTLTLIRVWSTTTPSPYCPNSKVVHSRSSLKDQITLLVYCFIICKSMKFSETSYRISKVHYLPVYFYFPWGPALSSKSLFLLDLKLSPHQQRCRVSSILVFAFLAFLQVQQSFIPSAAPNNAADTDCSSPALGVLELVELTVSVVLEESLVVLLRWCWRSWWRCWWCWWCIRRCCWRCCWPRNNSVVKLCIFWQLSSSTNTLPIFFIHHIPTMQPSLS